MNLKRMIKLIYSCLIMFILINTIIMPCTFGNTTISPLTVAGATLVKGLIVFSQVLVSGYFIIKFSITGIQYFTASAVTDKVANRNKMKWTLIYGVLAISGMYLISYIFGLD